ncbi:MAG: histidine phosphatase family protein [Rickettsiales bacterium]
MSGLSKVLKCQFSSLRGGVADAAIQSTDGFWIASPSPRNDEFLYSSIKLIFLTFLFLLSGCVNSLPTTETPLVRKAFYITRHGQTDQNVQKIVGNDKAKLTEAGRASAIKLSDTLFAIFESPNEQVYLVSSNLVRSKETARLIGKNSIKVIADNQLNERISGRLVTMPVEDTGKFLKLLEDNNLENFLVPLETESAENHISRTIQGINYHLQNAPIGKTPVFISHLKSMLEIAKIAGHEVEKFDNTTLYYFEPSVYGNWNISKITLENDGIIKTHID